MSSGVNGRQRACLSACPRRSLRTGRACQGASCAGCFPAARQPLAPAVLAQHLQAKCGGLGPERVKQADLVLGKLVDRRHACAGSRFQLSPHDHAGTSHSVPGPAPVGAPSLRRLTANCDQFAVFLGEVLFQQRMSSACSERAISASMLARSWLAGAAARGGTGRDRRCTMRRPYRPAATRRDAQNRRHRRRSAQARPTAAIRMR